MGTPLRKLDSFGMHLHEFALKASAKKETLFL